MLQPKFRGKSYSASDSPHLPRKQRVATALVFPERQRVLQPERKGNATSTPWGTTTCFLPLCRRPSTRRSTGDINFCLKDKMNFRVGWSDMFKDMTRQWLAPSDKFFETANRNRIRHSPSANSNCLRRLRSSAYSYRLRYFWPQLTAIVFGTTSAFTRQKLSSARRPPSDSNLPQPPADSKSLPTVKFLQFYSYVVAHLEEEPPLVRQRWRFKQQLLIKSPDSNATEESEILAKFNRAAAATSKATDKTKAMRSIKRYSCRSVVRPGKTPLAKTYV
jgi:hypothetical protein